MSVDLAFEEFARTEAAAIRLTDCLTPFVDFIIPLWSDWRVSIDVVAIVQTVVGVVSLCLLKHALASIVVLIGFWNLMKLLHLSVVDQIRAEYLLQILL